MCGEKVLDDSRVHGVKGSPPHVRGKGAAASPKSPPEGITPAYAGKRLLYPFLGTVCEDHPRVCGEKYFHLTHNLHI